LKEEDQVMPKMLKAVIRDLKNGQVGVEKS
jgi:hypothetical protein